MPIIQDDRLFAERITKALENLEWQVSELKNVAALSLWFSTRISQDDSRSTAVAKERMRACLKTILEEEFNVDELG